MATCRKETVCLCLVIFSVGVFGQHFLTPMEFATRVTDQMVRHPELLLQWDYGGAIALDAMHMEALELDLPHLFGILHERLDYYQRDPDSIGYKLLHDVDLPFDSAVGDHIGLFPVTYLNRIMTLSGRDPHYDNTSDVKIVETVARKYILHYPNRLYDYTFSRHHGWGVEPDHNASFVWVDDMYMGLTLISRLARHYNDDFFADMAGHMAVNFARHLHDPRDGLFHHGYNNADHKVSCCKWGRGNGWAMMAYIEVLEALQHFPKLKQSVLFAEVRGIYQILSRAVAKVQSIEDGRWHQVLDDPYTYHETSCTAMFVTSLIRGMRNEWLDRWEFGHVVERAWKGLSGTVEFDGVVRGICEGTDIMDSAKRYDERPTLFFLSSPGIGSVITSFIELHKNSADEILRHQDDFIHWFYGGAIILDGLFRIDDAFSFNYKQVAYSYLDSYATNKSAFGYQILHNETIPWFHNVGDQIGLFSINYLNRIVQGPFYKKTDLVIVDTVEEDYLKKFPRTLPDGTYVRGYGWPTEPNGTDTFLWCDDMYMGLTLTARLSRYHNDDDLALMAANQIITFARYLQDPTDGLYVHGANAATQHMSCCKWGRANGWSLMAQIEVLKAMKHSDKLRSTLKYKELLSYLEWQVDGLIKYQNVTDGRWHQVVNESSTFLETSATAMFMSGLAQAATHGLIPVDRVAATLHAGWRGLNRVITENGEITGVCNGLGVHNYLAAYEACATDYLSSGNGGLGAVLYAAADYQNFLSYTA